MSDVPELVAACCVLHNICEVHGESFDEEWLEGVDSSATVTRPPVSSMSGLSITEALMAYFHEE